MGASQHTKGKLFLSYMYVCIFTYAYGVLDYDVRFVSWGHGQMNEVTAVKEAHGTKNCCPLSTPLDCPHVPG